ncbi:uncharacterized protein LOC120359176 [Solenopsis invicta]|uniref:uncharacterized protein LOC120359176 n=1 Tax=Solenopsis invicta TaxID=13686 RepID=UPI00193CCA45|nr:uncharacterized protein LOC120359176 [Solenopsis invicta]
MKSNENPFRRVHSRSAVGRVARHPPPLAPPFPFSILHTYAFPPVLHPLPAAIGVLCVSRSQPETSDVSTRFESSSTIKWSCGTRFSGLILSISSCEIQRF